MRSQLQDSRLERRRLLNIIAFAFIGAAVVMGILYINLFQSAASDLTRILSDRTAAWLAAPAPWPRLAQVVALPRWQDGDALQRVLYGETLASTAGPADIAGVPMPLLREVTLAMDGFEIAYLPPGPLSGGEASVLVFVEIRDPVRRKRILGRLSEGTRVVDRHVGFRIDALADNAWQRWAGVTPKPPRVVFMEPWIVFAWGASHSLEDLLDARVGGRPDAIRRRVGFIDSGVDSELHGALDVATAWRFASRPEAPSQAPAMSPAGMLATLGLVSFGNVISDEGDVVSLSAAMTDNDLSANLSAGLTSGPHELLPLGPGNASLAFSWRGDNLPVSARAVAVAVQRLAYDFPQLQGLIGTDRPPGPGTKRPRGALPLLRRTLVAALMRGTIDSDALGGAVEVAFFTTAGPNNSDVDSPDDAPWLVLIKSESPERLEGELIAALSMHLGEDYALGEVTTSEGTLFIIADPGGNAVFVARRRDGLLEFAPDAEALEQLAAQTASGDLLGSAHDFVEAEALLPVDRGLTIFMPNALLRHQDDPLLRVIANQLKPTFPWLLTLDAAPGLVRLHSNIGPWTVLAALASAAPRDLDRLFLPGLGPTCRAQHEAMCLVYPQSPSCQPFELGRYPRIQRACDALARRALAP